MLKIWPNALWGIYQTSSKELVIQHFFPRTLIPGKERLLNKNTCIYGTRREKERYFLLKPRKRNQQSPFSSRLIWKTVKIDMLRKSIFKDPLVIESKYSIYHFRRSVLEGTKKYIWIWLSLQATENLSFYYSEREREGKEKERGDEGETQTHTDKDPDRNNKQSEIKNEYTSTQFCTRNTIQFTRIMNENYKPIRTLNSPAWL